MTPEQFSKAKQLSNNRMQIRRELKIWEEDLTHVRYLAYCQRWNNRHPVELESMVSNELFQQFREQVIQHLQNSLVEINSQFAAL